MDRPPIDQTPHSGPEDVLDRAVRSLDQANVPSGPPTYVVKATLAAMTASTHTPSRPTSFFTRRILMRSLFAAASVTAIAVAAVFLSSEFTTDSHAYADAVKQLKSARTLVYTSLIYTEDNPEPIKTKYYVAADGRQRSEMGTSNVTIMDENHHIRLSLIVDTKTALVYPPRETLRPGPRYSPRDHIEGLAKLSEKPDRELGEQLVDDRKLMGYEASQGDRKYTIWLDPKTKSITRIDDHHAHGRIKKSSMTDFQFDQPLDESLFSYELPAGYKVYDRPETPYVRPSEANVIQALRLYTQKSGGKFPKNLNDWHDLSDLFLTPADRLVAWDKSPAFQEISKQTAATRSFLRDFSLKDFAYLGNGLTTQDTKSMILWYKNKDGRYRAIYGDLSVKEITKESLAWLGEDLVIDALRSYTEKSGGKFPKSITDWGEWADQLSDYTAEGTEKETTLVMNQLREMMPFLMKMPRSDYGYMGDGKTIKDTDTIIFWYKNKDGEYRAIYGDLSVKGQSKESLPSKVDPQK